MKLSLQEILDATGGTLLSGSAASEISSVSIDSRSIGESCLFVPVRGETNDGHDYIEKALNGGAVASLTSEREAFDYYEDNHEANEKAFVLVNDTVRALQAIGKAARMKSRALSVGVTGSVGKTTTREMIARALMPAGEVYATSKNYNNRLGVPLTLLAMPEDADFAVLELGMDVPGELGDISALTNLSAAVITNIGDAHTEYYGSRERIAEEKMTVTRGFWPDSGIKHVMFLNGDDPMLMKYRNSSLYETVTFGLEPGSDYTAFGLHSENGCYVFDFQRKGETLLNVRLSALGRHNVLNALSALAVADRFSVNLQAAAESISSFTGFKGRLERREKNGILVIDDTYNASPASMTAGVKVLSELSYGDGTGRKIAVLGDMLELGDQEEKMHYDVGLELSSLPVDEYFFVGKLSGRIREGLLNGGTRAVLRMPEPAEDVLETLKETLLPGDSVYLKASRVVKLNRISEALTEDET